MPPTILRPQITVPLESGDVLVRDLPWQDAIEFLKKLSTHANDLLSGALAADGKVNVASLLPKLIEIITNVDELSTFLITRSTGKDAEWLKQFGTFERFNLLAAALEVNLSDGLIALGKKVAARLARVMPAMEKTSATPDSATS